MTSEQRTAAAEAESENSNLKNADLNSANNADRISNEEEMQDISEKRDSAKPADSQSLMPWSFRIGYFPRLLVNMFSALAVSFAGTFTYRNGIDISIPYGLVLAFAILGISIWLSRARSGAAFVCFVVLHMVSCCAHRFQRKHSHTGRRSGVIDVFFALFGIYLALRFYCSAYSDSDCSQTFRCCQTANVL